MPALPPPPGEGRCKAGPPFSSPTNPEPRLTPPRMAGGRYLLRKGMPMGPGPAVGGLQRKQPPLFALY